jgi:hypothetical protein
VLVHLTAHLGLTDFSDIMSSKCPPPLRGACFARVEK